MNNQPSNEERKSNDTAAECSQDNNVGSNFVWRNTLSDGMMPFTSLHSNYQEMPKKAVKASQRFEDDEDIFLSDLNKMFDPASDKIHYFDEATKQVFELKTVLYAKSLNHYVQLKKFDADKQEYMCKAIKQDKDAAAQDDQDIKVHQNDLSETVDIEVRRIDLTAISDAGKSDKAQPSDTGCFKVRITDPISMVFSMMESQMSSIGGGPLFFQGKLLTDMELTFEKIRATNKALFVVASESGSSGGGKKKKWWRFKQPLTNSTWYWSDNTDSVCFIPRRNITWYGWGIHSARPDGTDLQIANRWMLDDPDNITQDWIETTLPADTRDDETKTHEVLLSQFGLKPVKINAGQKLYLCNKSTGGRVTVNYGQQGDAYQEIEDQDCEFDIEDSKWDNNCTCKNRGMFPYILYS